MDLIYATPWVIGALLLDSVTDLAALLLIPLFAASWWQDWKSARTAASYFSGQLVAFDVLTAGNYIGLVDSWHQSAGRDAVVSTRTLFHWSAIFVIYIAWNLAIARKADQQTRRAFVIFSITESPLVIIGVLLTVAQMFDWQIPRWLYICGVSVLAVSHISLLLAWNWMSRRENAAD